MASYDLYHAFNIIELGGKYYFYDSTWMDNERVIEALENQLDVRGASKWYKLSTNDLSKMCDKERRYHTPLYNAYDETLPKKVDLDIDGKTYVIYLTYPVILALLNKYKKRDLLVLKR